MLEQEPKPTLSGTVTVFEETESAVSAREFAHFLYLFRAAYSVAVTDIRWQGVTPDMVAADPSPYKQEFYKSILTWGGKIEKWFAEDLGERELRILKMNKESPMMIWWEATMTALVLATILSGGEIDLAKGKFKLKSLGSGIRELKEAMSSGFGKSDSSAEPRSSQDKGKARGG